MSDAKNKNAAVANRILAAVGGESNVLDVIHCATRLRFELKDDAIANTAALEKDPGVIRVLRSGGQYQVVIGTHVANVFEELLSIGSLRNKSTGTTQNSGKKNVFNRFVSVITAIFTPFIGALAAAGVLKGLLTLAVALGWTTTESGTYTVLFSIADGTFVFLPVLLAFTAAKKFGTNQFTAVCLALALLHPSIAAAAAKAAATTGAGIPALDFFGIPVILAPAGYASSVIPIILAVLVQSYVERFFKKIIPPFLQLILVPLGILLTVAPFTFIVLGPLGTIIGDWLGKGYNGIYDLNPLIAGAVIGGFWQILVMFGMHWGLVPIIALNLQQNGSDTILPAALTAVIAQGGAALAVFFRAKGTKLKELSGASSLTPVFGITEPTIYGVNLPLKKPFIAGCIGGAIGGAIVGAFGSKAFANGLVSLLSLPTFIPTDDPQNTGGMFAAIIGTAVAFIIAFIIALCLGFKEEPSGTSKETKTPDLETLASNNASSSPGKEKAGSQDAIVFVSPVEGQVIPLEDLQDEVFSSSACGAGIAIKPARNQLYAPADGAITMIFPTKHAVGLTTDDGAEILIHIGIDTVKLNGDGFSAKVTKGQRVRQGDLLIAFDSEVIARAGLSDAVIMVIANSKKYSGFSSTHKDVVGVGDPILTITEKPTQNLMTEKYKKNNHSKEK